jgi:hypothetical protein
LSDFSRNQCQEIRIISTLRKAYIASTRDGQLADLPADIFEMFQSGSPRCVTVAVPPAALGPSKWTKTMKKALAIAAVAVGLSATSLSAQAQGYTVNGRAASPAEVQRLASYGAQPGQWLVDGYGISATGQRPQSTDGASDRKCWYVLDVLLCE